MKIDPFLKCLSATGIDTGVSVLGVYSFASGNAEVVWNQLYTTGFNYNNTFPYRGALPLIYCGSGSQTSGSFSGNQFYQVADVFGLSFSAIIALNYSGCLNTGTGNRLLISTNPNPSVTSSGVYLGISPASRLFLQASGYTSTVSQEVSVGDFVFFNVNANRFVQYGVFSTQNNQYYGKQYDAGTSNLEVTGLCFGGALNYPATFTGYSGKMTEIYLFSGNLPTGNIAPCTDCSFVSGYTYILNPFLYNQTVVTGSIWSGVSGFVPIGTQKVSVSFPKIGSTGNIYYDSGYGNTNQIYQYLLPRTSQVTKTGYYTGISFSYDNVSRIGGRLIDYYFDLGLVSGDVVEIYTSPTPTSNYGNSVRGFTWPRTNSGVQLFGNGLAETSGVDFGVAFNGLITGFDTGDYLLYDLVSGTMTMPYKQGYVYVLGGSSFLTAEDGSLILDEFGNPISTEGSISSTSITITGASGVDFTYPFQFDVYFDGQKMTTGVDYYVSGTGGYSYLISDTGSYWNYAFFDIDLANYLEIKFVPIQSGVIKSRYFPSGNSNYFSGVSGFGERVWINGIRQMANVDYIAYPRCRFCSGNYNDPIYPFALYNSSVDTIGFFK